MNSDFTLKLSGLNFRGTELNRTRLHLTLHPVFVVFHNICSQIEDDAGTVIRRPKPCPDCRLHWVMRCVTQLLYSYCSCMTQTNHPTLTYLADI